MMAELPADVLAALAPDQSLLDWRKACDEESDEDEPLPPSPPAPRGPVRRMQRELDGLPLAEHYGIESLPPPAPAAGRELSEAVLCRELLGCLRGIPSDMLTSEGRLQVAVRLPNLSRPALEQMAEPILVMVRHRLQITRDLHALAEAQPRRQRAGTRPLAPALRAGCDALLGGIATVLCAAEGTPPASNLPRLGRSLRLSGVAGWLEGCAMLCGEARRLQADSCGVTMLLDRALKLADRRAARARLQPPAADPGDPVATLAMLLLHAWLGELGAWLSSGTLDEATRRGTYAAIPEMVFVADTAGHREQDGGADWDGRWTVDPARVPGSICSDKLASEVLTCGKSVRFLALLRKEQQRIRGTATRGAAKGEHVGAYCAVPALDLSAEFVKVLAECTAEDGAGPSVELRLRTEVFDVPAAVAADANAQVAHLARVCGALNGRPLLPQLQKALGRSVRRWGAEIGDQLIRALHEHCQLPSRLKLVRHFFLLQHGGAMGHFCDTCLFPWAEELRLGSARRSADELRERFWKSLRTVDGPELEGQARQLLALTWEEGPSSAAAVSAAAERGTDQLPRELQLVGSVSMSLQQDAMLNVALPCEALSNYTKVLQVLLMLAYCKWLLVRMHLPRVPWPLSEVERAVALARLHLLRFVSALYAHCLHLAATTWSKLEHAQETARDVDTCRTLHLDASRQLLRALAYTNNLHWNTLTKVMGLCVEFARRVAPFVQWQQEQAKLRSRARPEGRKRRECPPVPAEFRSRGGTDLYRFVKHNVIGSFQQIMKLVMERLERSGDGRPEEYMVVFDFNHQYRER